MHGAVKVAAACAVTIAGVAESRGDCAKTARELVSRMTLEEKVSQTVSDAPAIPRLGLPAYEWWGEALHGVARAGLATVFPQSIGRAATFDEGLELRVGRAIGTEGRAKYNEFRKKGDTARYCGLTLWSPNVNMFRDPRWGRGQETFGEDPYLTGRMGGAFVRGLQGDDPERLLTAACAKHYLVHSGPEAGRRAFDAKVSAIDLAEYYLPAFKALVTEAKVADVMTSYNRVNGRSATADAGFVDGLLRKDWGHTGYVSSDYGAVEALYDDHRLADSREKTAAAALKAGVDLCAGFDYTNLTAAVRKGLVDEKTLDRRVTKLMEIRARLGILPGQPAHPYDRLGAKDVDTPENRALALECAEKSLVLVKNDGVLPLRREAVDGLYVTGPLAMDEYVLYGNYAGMNSRMSTVLSGLAEVGGAGVKLVFDPGCGLADRGKVSVGSFNFEGKGLDAVIACVGYSAALEGEESDDAGNGNGDRVRFGLPGRQLELLAKLREAAGKRPLVAVVFGGSPIDLNAIGRYADAIVLAWYPGEEGGKAVAKAIFGEVNPAGRLPFTVPASYDDLPPIRDYSLEGRTYRYATKTPQYPFGFGLSYTKFAYSDLRVERTADGVKASVEVRNAGDRDGDEVVQLYLRSPKGSSDRRLHRLAGFVRVTLAAGESRKVEFTLGRNRFFAFDDDGREFLPKGATTVFVGGGQPGFAETLSGEVNW